VKQIKEPVNWIGDIDRSPDGSKICFSSDKGAVPDIFVVSLQGGEEKRVVNLKGLDFGPKWSPG
jgi:Tol biopolymer transport system component